MAKLKAPLMSLGASGALGKAIVYFGWKGLDVVREYVVPANPKTTLQQTQRGYMTRAVAYIHSVQARAIDPMAAADIAAYALWGSIFPTPRTWFNQCVKNAIDQYKNGNNADYCCAMVTTPAALQIIVRANPQGDPAATTTYNVHWGTSKTALINTQSITRAQLQAGIAITGMPAATKIYLQLRSSAPAGSVGARSGIYYDYTP